MAREPKLPDLLYHWSPTARRGQIVRHGLRPSMRPVVSSPGWKPPYVCLAEDPDWGWALSGSHRPDVPSWDLWLVSLAEGHAIGAEALPGGRGFRKVHEWRVYDRIYKRGVVYVATRPAGVGRAG